MPISPRLQKVQTYLLASQMDIIRALHKQTGTPMAELLRRIVARGLTSPTQTN